MTHVFVTVGNSDDKLGQRRWANLVENVDKILRSSANEVHGQFHSAPDSAWQNTCWSVDLKDEEVANVKVNLAKIAYVFDQDTIAWNPSTTEFIPSWTPA
jgi:hypothetical protein